MLHILGAAARFFLSPGILGYRSITLTEKLKVKERTFFKNE